LIPADVQIGDLIVTRVEYKAPEGTIKGKTRPLIIISKPNSKGDMLAVAGSDDIAISYHLDYSAPILHRFTSCPVFGDNYSKYMRVWHYAYKGINY
jgi:hypothetical protein